MSSLNKSLAFCLSNKVLPKKVPRPRPEFEFNSNDLDLIIELTLKINAILKSFFKKIGLQLVDFKLELGYDCKNKLLLGDEISPDNCRLWDVNRENGTIVSLDKDRFRNDLGDLIEAYTEINRRMNDSTEFNP